MHYDHRWWVLDLETDDHLFYENNILALAWRNREKPVRTDSNLIQIWSRTSNWKLRILYHNTKLFDHKNEYNESFAQQRILKTVQTLKWGKLHYFEGKRQIKLSPWLCLIKQNTWRHTDKRRHSFTPDSGTRWGKFITVMCGWECSSVGTVLASKPTCCLFCFYHRLMST